VMRPLVATCSRGLEDVLEEEISLLGGKETRAGRGMVRFLGDRATMMRCCFALRTAIRVLIPLVSGPVSGREDLYRLASRIPWEEYLESGGSLAVRSAGTSRAFDNTRFAALVVKDAVFDRMKKKGLGRPKVDLDHPGLPIHLHLAEICSISLDAAGTPLSRRGYRPRGGPAPLNEALAAGLLLLAGFDGRRALLDPMGGTGTFAVEAAMIATRTAPGLKRSFAYESWPDHRPELTGRIRDELLSAQREAENPIITTDHDPAAVRAMRKNIRSAGMSRWIEVRQAEATMMEVPQPGSLIVINPPYGKRVGDLDALAALYSALGDRLKAVGKDCRAWILAGNRQLSHQIGLKAARRIPVFNGPIECRWMRFDLWEGSRKKKDPPS